MDKIKAIENEQLRENKLDLNIGDTVKVYCKTLITNDMKKVFCIFLSLKPEKLLFCSPSYYFNISYD